MMNDPDIGYEILKALSHQIRHGTMRRGAARRHSAYGKFQRESSDGGAVYRDVPCRAVPDTV